MTLSRPRTRGALVALGRTLALALVVTAAAPDAARAQQFTSSRFTFENDFTFLATGVADLTGSFQSTIRDRLDNGEGGLTVTPTFTYGGLVDGTITSFPQPSPPAPPSELTFSNLPFLPFERVVWSVVDAGTTRFGFGSLVRGFGFTPWVDFSVYDLSSIGTLTWRFYQGGSQVASLQADVQNGDGFLGVRYDAGFDAVELDFAGQAPFELDELTVGVGTTVPEPTTVALLAGGLAAVGLVARRRRPRA